MDEMNIQELEMKMWNAAKNRDSQAFLEVADRNNTDLEAYFTWHPHGRRFRISGN